MVAIGLTDLPKPEGVIALPAPTACIGYYPNCKVNARQKELKSK
jgi:hypothetical protein